MHKFAKTIIKEHGIKDSFYICNITTLQNKINEWKTHLPYIKPFYAVKCNPNKNIIKYMIKNKMGFDCASQAEIDMVLNLGATSTNIIYAHPCKRTYELENAISKRVKLTTFDTLCELEKIKTHAPAIDCLIRLKIDNPTAQVQLGLKYGVRRDEYRELIDAARDMNINITGAAFHVGSASKDSLVFKDAVEYSRDIFEYAREKGFFMNVLDIGGGFTKDNFIECAEVLTKSISESFKDEKFLKIIAEPGRFFAEDTFTFFVPVIGKRIRDNVPEYWIADGLYGSFNCMLYDGQIPSFKVLKDKCDEEKDSVIFGSSCDSADGLKSYKLPSLDVGDYLMVESFGAYTIAGAMDFNGINMSNPKIFYI